MKTPLFLREILLYRQLQESTHKYITEISIEFFEFRVIVNFSPSLFPIPTYRCLLLFKGGGKSVLSHLSEFKRLALLFIYSNPIQYLKLKQGFLIHIMLVCL